MKRPLLNLLTTLSLLLCVATVVLWVRSSMRPATWVLSKGPYRAVLVRSAGGTLQAGRQSVAAIGGGPGAGVTFDLSEPGSVGYRTPGSMGSFANGWYEPQGRLWSAGWTDVTTDAGRYRLRWNRVRLPYALLAAVTATLPAARGTARAWRRNRADARRRLHLCPACGYDLRATPGRCPECGTAS